MCKIDIITDLKRNHRQYTECLSLAFVNTRKIIVDNTKVQSKPCIDIETCFSKGEPFYTGCKLDKAAIKIAFARFLKCFDPVVLSIAIS